ncbi:hypothetical protein AXG93_2376s1080 [Marchantia polymorpha subsp. ruderalis]|uniref:Uncharacterized protein n=1 Tax=Marchantia polymorpha subsp. ruderalis TaxID=1480154 RepID=A0A176VC10_MARPO|nr:hypothetical protein AXG93_2376s1080 [Marchantia polymorpha subsp. ruderalis]
MQTSEASMSKEESVQHRVEVSDVDKDEVEHIAEHEPKLENLIGSEAFPVQYLTMTLVFGKQKAEQEVQLKPESDNQSESEKNEETEEVVCTEMGTCFEKRLLVATIDYKNDGPNNPITDPPH